MLKKIRIVEQRTKPSKPNTELLMEQIHKDFQNLSALKDNLYAFPSDVSADGELLKSKFAQSVDEFVKYIQKKMIEERGVDGLKLMKEMVECCNRKRLTLTPHYDPVFVEMVMNKVLSDLNLFEVELV
ncbi:hypothetical protein A2U01_0046030, partial [Trifolium medium]|nr:hypothetical protein [Trifolium medium]